MYGGEEEEGDDRMMEAGASAVQGEAPTAGAHSWIGEGLLRLVGAALQVLSTWAVVHVLTPDAAGVYFRGFVIALGLSTLVRAKYELYMAHHIIGRRAAATGYPDGVLLMQMAQRVLLRSCLLCAVLLVVTADLDIRAPQLQAALQTYLPFVLALPFLGLSSLLGQALRAANRTLGVVVAAYAVNVSILVAVVLAPPDASLALYSWAFLLGSVVSAAVAAALAGRVFPGFFPAAARPMSAEVLRAVDSREPIGLLRGALLWGTLVILSLWAPAVQVAKYVVVARTALIMDFFLPALNLTGCRDTLLGPQPTCAPPRRLLLRQLMTALLYSSALVALLMIVAPRMLAAFGTPYDSELGIYAVLLGVQWANGVGRPAVRHAVVEWDAPRIALAVGSGAVAAVLICSVAVASHGALAAAAGSLVGALIVNAAAIVMALSHRQAGEPQSTSPSPGRSA